MEPRDEELKQSGEVEPKSDNLYEEAVSFVKDSKDHFNAKQLPFVVDENFLNIVVKQAEEGEVTTSQLNAAGEKELIALTPKELFLGQFNEFIKLHDAQNPDAFNRIPRIHGLRESMRAIAGDKKLAEALKLAIMHRQAAMMREEQGNVDIPIAPGTIHEIMGEAQPTGPEVMDRQEREEVAEEMGEQATEAVVVDPDEAAHAARRMIEVPDFIKDSSSSWAPAEAVGTSQTSIEETSETESELQMNERFLRESQEELRDLYAQHRAAKPGSYEQDTLENQIRHAKEDVGKYIKEVTRLKGRA